MRTSFIDTLVECAARDERIHLISIDIGYSVLERFAARFPKRFLNVGIAEQNAIGVAAGLAMSGKVPFVYSIAPFATMRCFEQIRVDLAYQATNVKVIGVGAGLSYGPAGATHHSIEDIAIMRALPGMTVVCPGDPCEVAALLPQVAAFKGPAYVRIGKGGEPRIHASGAQINLGKAVELVDGSDFTILTTSNSLELGRDTVELLKKQGLHGSLVSMHTIKPLDREFLSERIDRGSPIFTIEEHVPSGGLGSAVAECIAERVTESGKALKFKRFSLPDEYTHLVGSQAFLRARYGLTAESIARIIRGMV